MDASEIVGLIDPLPGKKGGKPKPGAKAGKDKKEETVDLSAHRIWTASKLFTHLKFLQASMREAESKAQEFFVAFQSEKEIADDLRQKGVPEERWFDPTFALGDRTPMIRMIYTVLDRHLLLTAMGLGCNMGEDNTKPNFLL